MSKLNKILLGVVATLLVALGIVIYWQKVGLKESYWAVYLDTGDLYFGKLHKFPKLSLTDVWFIQRNAQDAQDPFSLVKFEQAFWGAEDKIYLNEKDVVWKAKLKENSQILQSIKSSPAIQAQPSQQLPQQATTTQQ